jgi:hypothetical protein
LNANERFAVLFTDVVNGTNIGVIQCGYGFCLAAKSLDGCRIASEFSGKKLDGNESVKPLVLGFINHTHPAAAEFFEDAVVRDGLASHG